MDYHATSPIFIYVKIMQILPKSYKYKTKKCEDKSQWITTVQDFGQAHTICGGVKQVFLHPNPPPHTFNNVYKFHSSTVLSHSQLHAFLLNKFQCSYLKSIYSVGDSWIDWNLYIFSCCDWKAKKKTDWRCFSNLKKLIKD